MGSRWMYEIGRSPRERDRRPRRCHPGAAVRLAIAIGIGSLLLAAVAPVAGAAPSRYVYEQCDSVLPDGGIAGARFLSNPVTPYVAQNTCAEPNGAISINQWKNSSEFSYWTIQGAVPPGGHAEAMTVTAAVCTGGQALQTAFAYRPEWSNSCRDEIRTFKESLDQPFRFYVWLGCALFQGPCAAGPWIRAHYFAITEVDPVPPVITQLAGTLLGGDVVRGRQTLRAVGNDKGGGVARVWAQVNGLAAGSPSPSDCQVARADNPSVSGLVAATAAPCPSSASASWTLDSGAYPFRDGDNTVQVCVSDFATLGDPNTTCTAARAISVDNSCGASPVSGGKALSVEFERSGGDTEKASYGEAAAVVGRLLNGAGDPVTGATVCVKSHTAGSADSDDAIGSARTGSDGSFSYQVPAGPNRELTVAYRDDAFQVSRDMRFYSHTMPALNARPRRLSNRRRVQFWGRLPGPGAGGRVVILQANVIGSKRWLSFRKATTAPDGSFRASYRFISTVRRTKYRFRALAPPQAGYPWLPGKSRPVRVVVIP